MLSFRWNFLSQAPTGTGADQRKLQSSVSLAFVRGIHRWSVDSPHKGPVTRKIFPFYDVIMNPNRIFPFLSIYFLSLAGGLPWSAAHVVTWGSLPTSWWCVHGSTCSTWVASRAPRAIRHWPRATTSAWKMPSSIAASTMSCSSRGTVFSRMDSTQAPCSINSPSTTAWERHIRAGPGSGSHPRRMAGSHSCSI